MDSLCFVVLLFHLPYCGSLGAQHQWMVENWLPLCWRCRLISCSFLRRMCCFGAYLLVETQIKQMERLLLKWLRLLQRDLRCLRNLRYVLLLALLLLRSLIPVGLLRSSCCRPRNNEHLLSRINLRTCLLFHPPLLKRQYYQLPLLNCLLQWNHFRISHRHWMRS